jgi:hypothetical protein
MRDHTNDVTDTMPSDIRRAFLVWCNETRLLGRDRMIPAFTAGWHAGHAAAVDQTAHAAPEDDDHATG